MGSARSKVDRASHRRTDKPLGAGPTNQARFRTAATVIILTVVYFVAAKLSLKLAYLHESASPVWPPAGIALAAVLLLGYRVWPAIFAGAFLVNLITAGNLFTSLGIAAGNTLEAVVGAWLVHRFTGGTEVFDRAQGVFKFALAVIVSTLISPTLGLTSLAVAGFADWANYGGCLADLVAGRHRGRSHRRAANYSLVWRIDPSLGPRGDCRGHLASPPVVRPGPRWFSAAG